MFASSSAFQINGGIFYGGDINIQNTQLFGQDEARMALEFGSAQDDASGCRLPVVGVQRNERQGNGLRTQPYDISHRPHISSTSSVTDQWNPILHDYSVPQSGHNLHQPSTIDPRDSYASAGPGSLSERDDLDSRIENSRAIGSRYGIPSPFTPDPCVPNSGPSHPPLPLPPNWNGDVLGWANLTNYHHVDSMIFEQGPTTLGQGGHFPSEPPFELHPMNNNRSISSKRYHPLHQRPCEPPTNISGGTFISGNVNHIQRHGENGLHILHRAIAGDAFHDSAERYPQPQCHPDTRTKILDVLRKWACGTEPPRHWTSEDDEDDDPPGDDEDSDWDGNEQSESESEDGNVDVDWSVADKPSSGILWLHGPAGSGKSAIAQSLCEQLQAEGLLGGSFFFKRGQLSRGTASKLFPTIAYQLALTHPEMNHAISQTVEKDPAIVHRSLSDQLRSLIIEPCRNVPLTHPVPIVIDGLDECEGQDIQQTILRSIGSAIQQQPLPVLFFIASRPEPHINEVFDEPLLEGFHRALNIRQSFDDVRKYLLDEFGRIRREHRTMATISVPWPPSKVVEDLVKKSSGYFIYASTIIKYIDDKHFRPTDRLQIILGIKEQGSASPFDTLDQLYIRILSDVPRDSRTQLEKILSVIATDHLRRNLSFSQVAQLLQLDLDDVRLILRDLHSVIDLPEDHSDSVAVHHASFLDFLHDSARSDVFYVGGPRHHTDVVRYMLKALTYRSGDPSSNRTGPIAWRLVPRCFQYISSAQPSPEFVPLLRSMNPDFFFWCFDLKIAEYFQFFNWLKNFHVWGNDFIPVWEDYRFMLFCEQAWNSTPTELPTTQNPNEYRQILFQVSPQLIRIFHAYKLFGQFTSDILYHIHLFLDLSWDELRSVICPLRGLIGEDKDRLGELFVFASDSTFLAEHDLDSTIHDLAWGGLHVATKVISGSIFTDGNSLFEFGYFLRSCRPFPDLLKALEEVDIAWASSPRSSPIPLPSDLYNIVIWLNTFPQPPVGLSTRFEQRLEKLRQNWVGRSTLDHHFEELWIKWRTKNRNYLDRCT